MAGFTAVSVNGREDDGRAQVKGSFAAAFPDPELQQRMLVAVSKDNSLGELFYDIAQHVLHSRGQGVSQIPSSPSKKRKLEHDARSTHLSEHGQTNGAALGALEDPQSVFSCKDVSFQIPLRKKLRLDLATDGKNKFRQEIRLVNQTSGEKEYGLRADQIEHAFCMAVPDKQARQINFVLYPKPEENMESVVFSLNEAVPAADVLTGGDAPQEGDTYATVTEKALNKMLSQNGVRLVKPSDAEFASAIPQSHRKGEKGYHVRAHRGSKEGYLFFLPTGIFFGFKKPLAFFPFSAVESISYTSVLQRTFNLVITTLDLSSIETKETEFSMLDQADFAGIDEYIKRHELNDASMAAQRRAKAYNVNKVKGEEGAEGQVNGGAGGGEDGESELQKAEQALQDAEDEEEEDYEASGGESDGEGEESGEDEEGDGDGGEGEYDEDDAEGEEL